MFSLFELRKTHKFVQLQQNNAILELKFFVNIYNPCSKIGLLPTMQHNLGLYTFSLVLIDRIKLYYGLA